MVSTRTRISGGRAFTCLISARPWPPREREAPHHQARPRRLDQIERLGHVPGLAAHLEARLELDQLPEPFPHQGVIVDDQPPDAPGGALTSGHRRLPPDWR